MSRIKSKTKANPDETTMTSIGPEISYPKSQEPSPSYEDIAMRAYQLHEQKGGSELDNWLEAEECLKKERKRP